jgi:hypothetical protein
MKKEYKGILTEVFIKNADQLFQSPRRRFTANF